MNDAVLNPFIASLITLILTKLFDSYMASRKNKLEATIHSLTAVDEITSAAADTIVYLKEERDTAREEVAILRESGKAKDALIASLMQQLQDAGINPLTNNGG